MGNFSAEKPRVDSRPRMRYLDLLVLRTGNDLGTEGSRLLAEGRPSEAMECFVRYAESLAKDGNANIAGDQYINAMDIALSLGDIEAAHACGVKAIGCYFTAAENLKCASEAEKNRTRLGYKAKRNANEMRTAAFAAFRHAEETAEKIHDATLVKECREKRNATMDLRKVDE